MTTSINTMLKNRRNKNKKGFSLVELIVVLVIMAILAAALVPTLIGYINQTRQSTAKNEASACVNAAQTIFSSAYADPELTYRSKNATAVTLVFTKGASGYTVDSDANFITEIGTLSEAKGTVSNVTINANGVVSGLTYAATNGETITYDGTTYNVN